MSELFALLVIATVAWALTYALRQRRRAIRAENTLLEYEHDWHDQLHDVMAIADAVQEPPPRLRSVNS